MKAVGIKELEARLSELVRLAKSGETVLVTERDEVVAELRPARHPRPRGTQEDVLEDLAASGDVTRSTLPKKDWTWKARGLGLPACTAKALLRKIRTDRG
jgi:antitoxin (DNA-binding transcriptional repressor) of toxin-antitoxin stability system